MTGYCVKCKIKQEIQNGQQVTMKNGAQAIKGVCGTCGTGIFSIQKKKAGASDLMAAARLVR